MKFLKYILLALALPFSAFAQRTNQIDNLWVPTSLRFSTGAAAGRVFTSDASGFGSWTVPATGGDVFLNGSGATKQNVYTSGTTNDFRGGPIWASILSMNTNTHIYSTIYGANRYAEGGLLIKPIGGTALGGAGFGVVSIVGNTTGSDPELMNLAIYMEGGRGVTYNARGIGYDTGTGVPFEIQDGSAIVKLSLTSSFDSTGTNFFGRLGSAEAAWIRGSTVTISSNLVINGSSVIGSQSSDPITANSSTMAIPNNFNIGSGALYISNAWGAGVNSTTLDGNRFRVNTPTTSIPSADTLLSASVSNRIALSVQAAPGQVSNIVVFGNSSGTDFFQFTTAGRFINTTGGNTVTSPSAGSSHGGTAVNGINLIIFSTAISTNLVINTAVGQTTPFLIIESTNGTSLVQIQENSIRLGTNGTAFSASIAGSFTFDAPSIAAQDTFYTNVVISGLAAGAATFLGTDILTSNIVYSAHATAANQATIGLHNITTGAIDPGNQTIRVRSIQP